MGILDIFKSNKKTNKPNSNYPKKIKKSNFNISKKELSQIMKKEDKLNKEISENFTKDFERNSKKKTNKVKSLVKEKKPSKNASNKIKKEKVRLTNCKESNEYFKTYIRGFDDLLKPGIPKGSSILVEGGPGSGKTVFCLTLLKEACKRGKKVLYMSFEEPEDKLRCHIKEFGLDVKDYEKKGLLYIKRFNALDIARSVEALLSEAKKELLIDVQPVLIPKDFEPDLVLIDSLSSISSAFSGESSRFRIYMEQLFRYLENHDISSFLIREVTNPTHIGGTFVEQGEAVSFLSDGIIAIYNVFHKAGVRERGIEVIKMRGANVKRKILKCEIKKGEGFVIYPEKSFKGDYKLT